MNLKIKDELRGRIRLHLPMKRLTCEEADILQYQLERMEEVRSAKVYERTADVAVFYEPDPEGRNRKAILNRICGFRFDKEDVPGEVLSHSSRSMNGEYKERLIRRILIH